MILSRIKLNCFSKKERQWKPVSLCSNCSPAKTRPPRWRYAHSSYSLTYIVGLAILQVGRNKRTLASPCKLMLSIQVQFNNW